MNRIPFAEYTAIDAVNWSSLKNMEDSPLHYKHRLDSKEDTDTTARSMGRLLHTLVLEPENFGAHYAIYHGSVRRGADWEDFKAANAGKTILKENELIEVCAQAAAVRAHPEVAPLLQGGEPETTVVWNEPRHGIRCKARLDLWHPKRAALVDLKGTPTTDPRRFGQIAARMGYFAQLAHYEQAVRLGLRRAVYDVLIIAVETAAPYDVAVFKLEDEDLEVGRIYVDDYLDKLKACRDSGVWPGRCPSIQRIQLPSYVFGDGDVVITMEES